MVSLSLYRSEPSRCGEGAADPFLPDREVSSPGRPRLMAPKAEGATSTQLPSAVVTRFLTDWRSSVMALSAVCALHAHAFTRLQSTGTTGVATTVQAGCASLFSHEPTLFGFLLWQPILMWTCWSALAIILWGISAGLVAVAAKGPATLFRNFTRLDFEDSGPTGLYQLVDRIKLDKTARGEAQNLCFNWCCCLLCFQLIGGYMKAQSLIDWNLSCMLHPLCRDHLNLVAKRLMQHQDGLVRNYTSGFCCSRYQLGAQPGCDDSLSEAGTNVMNWSWISLIFFILCLRNAGLRLDRSLPMLKLPEGEIDESRDVSVEKGFHRLGTTSSSDVDESTAPAHNNTINTSV